MSYLVVDTGSDYKFVMFSQARQVVATIGSYRENAIAIESDAGDSLTYAKRHVRMLKDMYVKV